MSESNDLMCYTIGHSNYAIDKFLDLLIKNSINCLIDVRANPYSRHAPQFNRENLKKILKANTIIYIDMGALLGGRYTDPKLLFSNGKVDYSKVSQKEEFREGITRIINGIKKGFKIALMCSEKDPMKCHRFSLISHELKNKGVGVNHILESGGFISNIDLEKKMLDSYKDHSNQLEFFKKAKAQNSDLDNAYQEKNKEIAYTIYNK